MALDIVVTTDRYHQDPNSRNLIEYIRTQQKSLLVDQAVLYYDFPAYVDYETETTRPDILIFSPNHGFVAVRFLDDSLFVRARETIEGIDRGLNDFCSNLYSRIIRSRELRVSRTKAILEVHPLIFDTTRNKASSAAADLESETCSSYEQFAALFNGWRMHEIPASAMAEARSVVEGAKALSRPLKRTIDDPEKQPLAVAMAALEDEIANFDQKQRHIALVDVGGPARIRGLAGSGKTVILAMKVAHLHLNNPSATILITFLTKSLRATIKNLVTKFYRHYSESDPDWKTIHIRHGWGGSSLPGVYSDACRRIGRAPLTLSEAQSLARGHTSSAFEAACSNLMASGEVKPYYDHILIDEGQDFPVSFYQLCYTLAKGEQDRKSIIWAYDELQDIMNVKIRQPKALFGVDDKGRARVDLDRSSAHMPPGATNDAVLSKCYRNQRDVLVTAHALGFGVYGGIVQLLESADHWRDVGYQVESGELATGSIVRIRRPDENSPLHIGDTPKFPLIDWYLATDLAQEVEWVTASISKFIGGGLSPEEIVVISLDDRHAKFYLASIAEDLAEKGIATNNVIADPYNEPPFSIAGKVTLSTVYRAKGNEAAAVFAVGVDGVERRARSGRNKIFTAFTRSKAWLRVSGIGAPAQKIFEEMEKAKKLAPALVFKMPDLAEVETIQRGFSRKQAKAKAAREAYIKTLVDAGYSFEEIEEELAAGLRRE